MGMALKIVVQPDLLEDPSDSVRFCTQQGLEPDDGSNPQEGESVDDTEDGENSTSPEQDNPQDGTTSRGSSMQTSLFRAAALQLVVMLMF
jgi:hypothetical protein